MEAIESNANELRQAQLVPLDMTGSDAEEAVMALRDGRNALLRAADALVTTGARPVKGGWVKSTAAEPDGIPESNPTASDSACGCRRNERGRREMGGPTAGATAPAQPTCLDGRVCDSHNGIMMGTWGRTSPQLADMLAKLPPDMLARAKAFQGKPVNWFDPQTVIVCVLTKVNAPCRRQLTAEELADAIRAGRIDLSQVDSFYTEIDVDAQRVFAAELGIAEEDLLRTAKALAECIREELPLLAS